MGNGLGCYSWSSGVTLTGVFERGFCNRVGKKTYPSGETYVGELFEDQEHGSGVMSDRNGTRIVGTWNRGVLVEELVEMIVPALEVDSVAGPDSEQRVFVSMRDKDAAAQTIPVEDAEAKSIVLYTSGDKYIGGVKAGAKHGEGMYVYAD